MTVTEGLMQVGSWSIKLDGAPIEMRREFDWFSNIVITPARIYDTNIDRDLLLAAASYTGICVKRNIGEGAFGGFGMLGYVQTGKGHAGAIGLYDPTWPADFDDIVQAWFDNLNGLEAGTNAGIVTTTIKSMEQHTYWPPTKPVLDEAAKQTGNEYVVRPDGTVDYGFYQNLFTLTPTVMVAPGVTGTDVINALEVKSWSVDQDLVDFRNFAFATSEDGTTRAVTPTSGSPLTVYGFGGLAVAGDVRYFERVRANSNDSTDLTDAAVAASTEYADVNYRISCSVDEFCIPRLLTPGDSVYVYDVDNDLVSTSATEVIHFGRSYYPVKVRCYGYTWPVQAGMGVYVINNATQDITDVSDFVHWETGTTRLDLGSPPKRLATNTTISRFK